MKDKYTPIGEFCKTAGIPVSKLRYYESLGLIKPAFIDPENSYHYYSQEQYEDIELIQICRQLEIPVKEISRLLSEKNIEKMLEVIDKQKYLARKKLLKLQELYYDLSWLRSSLAAEDAIDKDDLPIPEISELKERYVLMAVPDRQDNDLSVHEQAIHLQKKLSKEAVSEIRATNSVVRTYGYRLDSNMLKKGQLILTGKFLELPKFVLNTPKKLYKIPAGTYLSLTAKPFSDDIWLSRIMLFLDNNNFEAADIYMTALSLHFIHKIDSYYNIQVLLKNNN